MLRKIVAAPLGQVPATSPAGDLRGEVDGEHLVGVRGNELPPSRAGRGGGVDHVPPKARCGGIEACRWGLAARPDRSTFMRAIWFSRRTVVGCPRGAARGAGGGEDERP